MKIPIWKIICFILVVAVVTVFIFPDKERMAVYYKNDEMYEEALAIVEDLLKVEPNNPGLLILESDLFNLTGEPDMAIAALNAALHVNPVNVKALSKMAAFYEVNREPLKEMEILKRVVDIEAGNIAALTKLVKLYHYYGFYDDESRTILKLLSLEMETDKNDRLETVKSRIIKNDSLVKKLTSGIYEFTRIAGLDKSGSSLKELTTGLYVIRNDYMNEIDYSLAKNYPRLGEGAALYEQIKRPSQDKDANKDNYQVDRNGTITRCFELFMRMGIEEKGRMFAERLDAEFKTGDTNRMRYVQVLRWNGMGKVAAGLLKKLGDEFPNNPEIFRFLADIALEYGDIAGVVAAYEALLKISPDSVMYNERLAGIYLSAEKPDKAYAVYKKLVKINNNDQAYLIKMLEIAGLTGDPNTMREAVAFAQNSGFEGLGLMLKTSELLLATGDVGKSIDIYNRLLIIYPDNTAVKKLLAKSYIWANQPKKAFTIMRRAVGDAGDKDALLELARYAASAGFNDEAFIILEKLYEEEPEDSSIHQDLLRFGMWTNRVKRVAEILGGISDLAPNDFDKALKAGDAFAQADLMAVSVRYYERSLDLDSGNIDLRRKLAKYSGWLGLNDKALTHLEYLQASGYIEPGEAVVLAQLYLDKKDGKRALACLDMFIETEPLPVSEGIMVATAHELMGEYDLAIAVYNRLAQTHPDNVELLVKIGNQALWINRTDVAFQFFKKALKRDRRNARALKGIAQIYAQKSDIEMAISSFTKYNALNPGDYEAHFMLGELYYSAGDKSAASIEYKTAMNLINKN